MPPKKKVVRVALCLKGCGDVGIAELGDVCMDCHTQAAILRDQRAPEPIPSTLQVDSVPISPSAKQLWQAFQTLPREADAPRSVQGEIDQFTTDAAAIHARQLQLQQYMAASSAGDEVDKAVWRQAQGIEPST
ncbi:hypothetical protein SPRG_11041 [Saprolegnia parasitica CBS 223.65]|uniref:A20-type domain-containing protein n=1 Tax=Saprolegnia parasitica (strain CBS 223.65) TaxID=695850 RepID=A0A067C340_SAPPC|nr:hypothetical protein SPRG_11041 [Saprolegnia parasitica CBS 223.65]KDO21182.1 hypothetical protein SPRG_11041 [Saprolegnia parasitica CBS 223.65]|eukprot:XP_012208092.1 hypothetical protein SPRG_11041 [Saprolegnia parasitica CBS 223.65]